MVRQKKLLSSLLILPILLGGATTAFAAQRTKHYSYDVPRLNGHSTTGSIKKLSRTSAVNNNTSNGQGTSLKSWIITAYSGKPVTDTESFASGQRINMTYKGSTKDYVGGNFKMSIGTGFLEFHNIHTSGYWSPDDK